MTTIVGAVYKWNEGRSSSTWKRYFLALDEATGRILWVNKFGKIKGGADLKIVISSIFCCQFQQDDHRLTKTDLKFSHHYLTIPMITLSAGVSVMENQEFAFGSSDELETWMRKFAQCIGSLDRFLDLKKTESLKFKKADPEFLWTSAAVESLLGNFNVYNRYNYAPDYYPSLWKHFSTRGVTNRYDNYGCSCTDDVMGSNNWTWFEESFCFAGTNVIDPTTGTIMDPSCNTGNISVSESHFWSLFLSTGTVEATGTGEEAGGMTVGLAKV